MTVHSNPVPSIRDIINERRELFAYLNRELEAMPGTNDMHRTLFKLVQAYADQSLTVEELMLASIISNKEAILWMKEEIAMLRDKIDDHLRE